MAIPCVKTIAIYYNNNVITTNFSDRTCMYILSWLVVGNRGEFIIIDSVLKPNTFNNLREGNKKLETVVRMSKIILVL